MSYRRSKTNALHLRALRQLHEQQRRAVDARIAQLTAGCHGTAVAR